MRQSRNKKLERKKKHFKDLGIFLIVIFLAIGLFSIFLFDGFRNEAAKDKGDELPEQSVLNSKSTSAEESPSDTQNENHSNELSENKEHEDESEEQMETVESVNEKQSEKNIGNKQEEEQRTKEEQPMKNGQNTNGSKTIYLTFDDGPQDMTMDILKLLDKYNAKATFFMLEPYMREYPDVIDEMINRGHSVGVHSVTHNKKIIYASSQSVVNEMTTAKNTLEQLTGVESSLMRVPYGSVPHMKPEYIQAVENHGFLMWDWNVDSMDWKFTDGSFVNHTINQIEAFKKNEPMVVLMHDRTTTLAHLEKLLIYLQENDYEMLAIDESMEPVQFKQ